MKGNLLIIDDESEIVENLQFLLRKLADTIFTAGNGQVGWEIIQKQKIDCIICDISMPVMNGVELIKRVRAEKNDVPFIFYTGHGSRELMLEAAKYGAFDFLDKPSVENLEGIVKSALNQNKDQIQETPSDQMSEYARMLKDLE